jgi:hypothetical protein
MRDPTVQCRRKTTMKTGRTFKTKRWELGPDIARSGRGLEFGFVGGRSGLQCEI